MSILDKFRHKKEDPFAKLSSDLKSDFPSSKNPPAESAFPSSDSIGKEHDFDFGLESEPKKFPAPSAEPNKTSLESIKAENLEKDIQLISAKLDAIRATLENINHRIANIEKMNQEKKRFQW